MYVLFFCTLHITYTIFTFHYTYIGGSFEFTVLDKEFGVDIVKKCLTTLSVDNSSHFFPRSVNVTCRISQSPILANEAYLTGS